MNRLAIQRFFNPLLALCLFLVAGCSDLLAPNDLNRFSQWIAGEWTNEKQINAFIAQGLPKNERPPRYAMRYTLVEAPAIEGRLFAIENYDGGAGFSGPISRVSLHRFMLSEDGSTILHEILFLKDEAFRKRLTTSLAPLSDIKPDDIRVREDCRLYWIWDGASFEGATKPGACVTNSYTDRDITVEGFGALMEDQLIRHDRNFEMTGEEIPRPGYEVADTFTRPS